MRRTPMPPLLFRALGQLRALPLDNPRYASDALLVAADAFGEAALQFEVHGATGAADAAIALKEELRRIEDRLRATAPWFAEPQAPELLTTTQADPLLRREPQP